MLPQKSSTTIFRQNSGHCQWNGRNPFDVSTDEILPVLDIKGNVIWKGEISVFGDVVLGGWIGEALFDERVRFTGKDYDEETGLYYFNARWYDPLLGRFTSEDPARDGINWHVYVRNNPLRFIDPSGLDAVYSIDENRIQVSSRFYIYGDAANADQALLMGTNMNNDWNSNGDGWTYNHTAIDLNTGEATTTSYHLEIDFEVVLLDPENPTRLPTDTEVLRITNDNENVINVGTSESVSSSYVRGGNTGEFRGYAPDPSCHEAGHLLRLRDRYTRGEGANTGWTGNIMAEPAQQGSVQQKILTIKEVIY